MAEAKPRRAIDPELQAMAKIDRIVGDMDDGAKARVVGWIMAKYIPGETWVRVGVANNPVEAKE